MKLVDDLYGRIEHILLSYNIDAHALLIEELARDMADDVIISVAYPEGQEGLFENPPRALDAIRKRHKNVEPFPIKGCHIEWVQDTVHAYEKNTLMHSIPSKILTASSNEIKGDVLNPNQGANILDAGYWDDIGFRIIENDSTFMVVGGETMRCGDITYFGTESWYNFLDDVSLQDKKFSKEIRMFKKFGIKKSNIEKMFQAFLGHVEYISDSCEHALIGPSINKEVGMHLDLYFHPHEKGCFISESSLYSEDDINLSITEEYRNIEKNLGLLKIKNSRGVPIFLPRNDENKVLIIEQGVVNGKVQVPLLENSSPFYSPINSLYEVYETGGNIIRNVYMPHYGRAFESATNKAAESFMIEGFDVKRIGFPIIDAGGGLRCCSKVLRRK